jgi:hypothetical protein
VVHDVEKKQAPGGLRAWLRHAFAVEKYDESSLTEQDKEVLQSLAKAIHEKRMTAAAIVWVESNRHMNFIGSQFLVMFQPIFDLVHPVVNPILRRFGMYIAPGELPKLQAALEKRYSVEYFIQRLEACVATDYNVQPAGPPGQDIADAPADGKQQDRQRKD